MFVMSTGVTSLGVMGAVSLFGYCCFALHGDDGDEEGGQPEAARPVDIPEKRKSW